MATPLLKHTWETVIKNDTGTSLAAGAIDVLGDSEFNERVSIAVGETAEIDCGSIDKTKIASIVLVCDKAATVDTNAADATGGQAITLGAGKAWAWNNQMAAVLPVTQNITKIFVTNNDATKPANFRAAILLKLLP